MPTLPSKKEVLLELLEKSNVLVHLDARRDDVVVPKNLKTNPQLILQIALRGDVPARDLDVGDEGVKCTLSFQRVPFFCELPYPAIFAMVAEDGRAMVWPEDVPDVVARAAEDEARKLGMIKPVPSPKEDAKPAATPNVLQSKKPVSPRAAEDKPKAEQKRAPKANKPAPVKPQAAETPPARPKRELPPYLRVIK